MEERHFHPGPDLRAESASPTNSIDEIGDGVCSEGRAAQPRGAAVSPEPTSRVEFRSQPRAEAGLVWRTTTQRRVRTQDLPRDATGADHAEQGAGGERARAEAMPRQAGPPTIGLPQLRRPRPRRLLLETCLLLLLEHQPHRIATEGATLLGETPVATTAGGEIDLHLPGKVAKPSRFGDRSSTTPAGTIAARAAAAPPREDSGGKDRVAAVAARAAREDEADEGADSRRRAS